MDENAPASSPYKRILFCTDFSENADFAFDFAIDAVGPAARLQTLSAACYPGA